MRVSTALRGTQRLERIDHAQHRAEQAEQRGKRRDHFQQPHMGAVRLDRFFRLAPGALLRHAGNGEGRHTRYVPPLTNPVFNETPYITTEARGIYMYNEIPDGDDFVTDGGNINLAALQLRVALTERLGFIATKDR